MLNTAFWSWCIARQRCNPRKMIFTIILTRKFRSTRLKNHQYNQKRLISRINAAFQLNYLCHFIAYKVNDWCDIFIAAHALFIRFEFHKESSILINWIGHGGTIVFETFFYISFRLIVKANACVWRAHLIVTILRWFANIYQKSCGIIYDNFVIINVIIQWHQIEFLFG